ncbi:SMP-30/gluconolactonase/LRE family protein [Pinisolibacter aquiterrae]|uniref:SMP-30/gluconolactonase/LRE family protein n=1 Tax=Pinisolibacter aquiterrae TaxID=2815579 RepID=UPI001E49A64B|nr:SMP-30/gluconolactonase/LRE family protein [Pinisolibacter aquiterrae]
MNVIRIVPDPRRLIDHACRLGESPLWDDRRDRLFFVDIAAGEIHHVSAEGSSHRVWPAPIPERATALGLTTAGRLVVALTRSVVLFDPDAGTWETLAEIDVGPSTMRLNDGKVGPDGAFWVGSMDETPERPPIAALWRVSADGAVEKKLDGLRVANGLAWDAAGTTMYLADSRGPWIDRFTFDPATGTLSDRARLATLDDATGRPDGGCCDVIGHYWSAGVSSGHINRFAPDGRLLEHWDLPVDFPTMPCFGGEGMRTLFVTSLDRVEEGRRPSLAPAGSVIAFDAQIAGLPPFRMPDPRG